MSRSSSGALIVFASPLTMTLNAVPASSPSISKATRGMFDDEVHREDLRGVVDDDGKAADRSRSQAFPAFLGIERPG